MSTEEKPTKILQHVTVRFAVNPDGYRIAPGDLSAHLEELAELNKLGVVDVQFDPDGTDSISVVEVTLPYERGAAFGEAVPRHVEMQEQEARALEERYAGKEFVFYSPYEEPGGWHNGDVGTIVRLCRQHTDEAGDFDDLWIARHNSLNICRAMFGGEAFIRETLKPLIPEHRFLDWHPIKDVFKRSKDAKKGRPLWEVRADARMDVSTRVDVRSEEFPTPDLEELLDATRKDLEKGNDALAVVFADGEWIVAQCFDPDIASQGKTVPEALSNLALALDLAMDDEVDETTDPKTIAQLEAGLQEAVEALGRHKLSPEAHATLQAQYDRRVASEGGAGEIAESQTTEQWEAALEAAGRGERT